MAYVLMPAIMNVEALLYQKEMKEIRNSMRDISNPFDLSHNDFRTIFRVNMDIADELIDRLAPRLQRIKSYGVTVEEQVLVNAYTQ